MTEKITIKIKPNELPVSTVRVSPEDSRVSDDGNPSEVLPDPYRGYIKRKVLTSSGKYKNQYLTPDLYIITSWPAYTKALAAHNKALAEQSESAKLMERIVELDLAPPVTATVAKLDNERFDQVAENSIRNQTMIEMDEVFPDIGMTEQGGNLIANPAIRARQASVHGGRYQKEYILRTVHRLMLRRVPVDEIARMFNVKVDTVYKWIDELTKRLQNEASGVTLNHIAGDTLAFYSEIRAMGLTTASTTSKVTEKIRGLEVALRAEQDKHKFLQVAGFYDTAKLGRDQIEDESARKAKRIIEMTQNLLNGTYEETGEEESDYSDEENFIL